MDFARGEKREWNNFGAELTGATGIGSSGGGVLLAFVLNLHISTVKVQRQGMWAILTLAGTDETARAICLSGCDRAAINAMLQHRHDAAIQQFGLWAVSNMALAGSDIARRLKKGGCIELCRIAIETHPHDAEVIRQARHALGVLK